MLHDQPVGAGSDEEADVIADAEMIDFGIDNPMKVATQPLGSPSIDRAPREETDADAGVERRAVGHRPRVDVNSVQRPDGFGVTMLTPAGRRHRRPGQGRGHVVDLYDGPHPVGVSGVADLRVTHSSW